MGTELKLHAFWRPALSTTYRLMMEKVVEKEPVSPPPLTAGAGAAAAAELSHELEPGVAYIKTE